MNIFGKSDMGLVRTSNQDCCYIDDNFKWVIVADGMGGHNGGETASSMAVDIVKKEISDGKSPYDAIVKANTLIYEKSLKDKKLLGMGTTVVFCRTYDEKAEILHVGDSRAYKISNGKMQRITKDHSIVQQLIDSGTITEEQAKFHPQKNLITRAVGTENTVSVDFNTVDFKSGDIILLCSDGLSSYVDEEDILNIIACEKDLKTAVFKLIGKANENGGKDNITVVLLSA